MFPTTNGHVLIKNVPKRMRKGQNGRIFKKNVLKRPPNGANERILDENASEIELEA